jgi:hypothetical protein
MTPRHLCVLTIHFARLIFTRLSSAAVGRKQANLVHSSFTSAAVGEEANLIALDMHYPVNNNIQLKISLGSHLPWAASTNIRIHPRSHARMLSLSKQAAPGLSQMKR